MDRRERWGDLQEAVKLGLDGLQARTWTALPAIVEAFDVEKMTATVNFAIKGKQRKKNGTLIDVSLPLSNECPVQFPRGGKTVLTFPVKKGDECLIVFASRCIDLWWKNGGVQPQMTEGEGELRMHDLSDGFILLGFCSLPNVIKDLALETVQLRSLDGKTYVELDPEGQIVKVVAPGGINITGKVTITGDVSVDGKVDATGEGTFNDGHTVSAHKHGGVQTGSGQTGSPTG